MATYYARKTGNINASDVWATTPSGAAGAVVFTNSDVLISNSFTITINVNTTVGEIRNDNTGGATAGGTFTLSSGINLTANIFSGSTNTTVLTYGGTTTATITGNITCASGSGFIISAGTANFIGNVTAGTGSSIHGIQVTSNGIVNLTGNLTGGSGTSCVGLYFTGTNTVTVTGTVTGGSGTTNANGLQLAGNGTATINGTVVGGTNSPGVSIAGSVTGILTATRAKGNGFGNGSIGLTSQVGISANQTGTCKVYEIEYGDLGQTPTSGPVQLFDASTNVCLVYRTGGLGKKTLIDSASSSGAFPSASNVRSGVSYNNGNTVGTMAVPSANSVNYGVSVDNTTGTAVLTPSGVWDHPVSSITTVGSIGERAKNCSTIASVGQQLANALSPK